MKIQGVGNKYRQCLLIVVLNLTIMAAMSVPPALAKAGPGPGAIWIEPVTGMEFVFIPAGCFQMGQTEEEKEELIRTQGEKSYRKYCSDELPRHEVCLNGFWMGRTEVTIGHYRTYLLATGDTKGLDRFEESDCPIFPEPPYFLKENKFGRSPRQPMVEVSWKGASAFAAWLSKKTGKRFGLPTEAQWEYAARGGVAGQLYSGSSSVDRVAWYESNSGGHTREVGLKQPNGFGLYDMSGNVWEWCKDVYDKKAYARHGRNNPMIPSGGDGRVIRGGSWYDGFRDLRSACRYPDYDEDTAGDLGFRLCVIEGKR